MAAETTPDTSTVTLETYKPSEYAETSWPRIEEKTVDAAFQATAFETIVQPVFATDPMFANFEVEKDLGVPQQSSVTPFEPESLYADSDPSREELQEQEEIPLQSDVVTVAEAVTTPVDVQSEAQEQFVVEELEPSEEPVAGNVEQSAHEAAIAAAREEGYALGSAEARQQLEAMHAEIRQHFTGVIEDFKAQSQEMIQEYERKAVELALLVARRMVGTVVETQREYIISVIREAMQSAGTASIEAIRVSPQDFEFLANQGAGEQLKAGADYKTVFTSDETIKAGCIIITSSGEINFDLDKAWERLRTKVVEGPQS